MEKWKEVPLIVTATANVCWMHPEVEYPRTPGEIAEEAVLCLERGAAVFHTHAEGRWKEVIAAIRERCGIIIQCGMSSASLEERADVFTRGADMISVILSHHDEAFKEEEFNVLHTRAEMASYARRCAQHGVVPEFEVWHTGSIWNLRHLISEGVVTEPYVTTLFLGWPGGTWSPPTVEEYLYRRRQMPEGCVCTVSVMGEEQMKVLAAAVVHGDHVRVGTEDYPFDHAGRVAPTHELVDEARRLAEALGRPVASVEEARRILGIERRG